MLPLFLHLQKRFESPGMLGVAGALGPVAAEIGAGVRLGSEVTSREGLAGSVVAQEAGKGTCAAPIAEPVDYVAAMAEAFKLSPRETEVLRYLGRGRSVPYMREVMTLSKSTIETHIKHIYAKTDVHSKQELIDLIEFYQGGNRGGDARLGFIGKLAKLTLDKNICSLIMNENKCSKGWVYP